ncbi:MULTISPECIES: LysM domain-containing protein [unclassified Crossiella]|uniref:LysM domain-containing protein n=1 Tax=unclassified Crossiella TaxID=2620835 RepID=UPI001FFEB645|nr:MULTISPECIES: LysM domain-containing protein [unclassified Crossiella]MCK2242408.1 LysM domain-containing protein [Crossiella sp. S99.2]MCK2254561.1 LysM domain-containing protein [Crossiella sp. S99.1]
MTEPLEFLPDPTAYPRTSRYYGIPTAERVAGDGRRVPYLTRRLLPDPAEFAEIGEHVVREGERVELIADRQFGDAGQWWRIADANPVLDPRELAEPGRRLRITLPAGVPGPVLD